MLKKFLLTLAAALIIGSAALYYYTYQNYQKFIVLSDEEQVREASTSPIKYMLMKDLLFWIEIPEDRFKPQSLLHKAKA